MSEQFIQPMPPNRELTAQTRQNLKGKWTLLAGLLLLPWAIAIVLNAGTGVAANFGILCWISAAITMVVGIVVGLAIQRCYLVLSRGKDADLKQAFAMAWNRIGDIIGTMILYWLYSMGYLFILFLLIMGGGATLMLLPPGVHVVGVMFLGIGGIAWLLWFCRFMLTYALPFFILIDDERCSPRQAMRLSRELMTGNRGQLAWLWTRLFGWVLVGFCSCCIGFLWISPYIICCTMRFYDAAKAQREERLAAQADTSAVARLPYPGMSKRNTFLLLGLICAANIVLAAINSYNPNQCAQSIKVGSSLLRINLPVSRTFYHYFFSKCPNPMAAHRQYIVLPADATAADKPENRLILVEMPGNHFGDIFHVATDDGKVYTFNGPFPETVFQHFHCPPATVEALNKAIEKNN